MQEGSPPQFLGSGSLSAVACSVVRPEVDEALAETDTMTKSLPSGEGSSYRRIRFLAI